jgi:hypothetical protein
MHTIPDYLHANAVSGITFTGSTSVAYNNIFQFHSLENNIRKATLPAWFVKFFWAKREAAVTAAATAERDTINLFTEFISNLKSMIHPDYMLPPGTYNITGLSAVGAALQTEFDLTHFPGAAIPQFYILELDNIE